MKTETMKTEAVKTKASKTQTLSPDLLHKMNAYWRAANYLSVRVRSICTTIRC